MKTVSVLLVGVGGYGGVIAREVFEHRNENGIEVVGIVDPAYDASPVKATAEELGVPHFATLDEFYAVRGAELAILCSPIQFHEEQACFVMEHGSDCLCEKPTAATVAQSDRMAAVAKRTGRNLFIGYQLCYVPSVLSLKRDIMSGALGKPKHLSASICWPRGAAYYARPWCGRIKKDGRMVLDSIAMNACAHYLNIMLFLLGDTVSGAAAPEQLEGVTCRINGIETFDTAFLRVSAKGATVDFMATHSSRKNIDPRLRLEFEGATVMLCEGEGEDAITATFADGTVKHYGAVKPYLYGKMGYCAEVIRGNKQSVCTTDTARAHLLCVNAATEKIPVLTNVDYVMQGDVRVIDGIDELMQKAFDEGKMPWMLTDRFGAPTKVELNGYGGWEE